MNLSRHFIKIFSLTITLLCPVSSYAQQWYHVEVIVFEQLNTVTDEKWPVMSALPDTSLTPSMATNIIQPASNSELKTTAQNLRQSARYRVHYHRSWQQPIETKRRAKMVKISSPDQLIEGGIKLYKGTYLYAKTDLWLNKNRSQANQWSDSSPNGIVSAVRNPHLAESRRVRSNKLHFFDHPEMGVLMQLTTIETPQAVAKQQDLESFSLPIEAQPIAAE